MPQVLKTDRNKKVYEFVMQGASYREAGRKFKLAHSRVAVIFWNYRKELRKARKA